MSSFSIESSCSENADGRPSWCTKLNVRVNWVLLRVVWVCDLQKKDLDGLFTEMPGCDAASHAGLKVCTRS
jgi:hypothetical protein